MANAWEWHPDEMRGAGSILDARYRVVPFVGRDAERSDLTNWCRTGDGLIRLYHAAGGIGKTRLLMQVCQDLKETHRWLAGFIDEKYNKNDAWTARAFDELVAQDGAKLLVVDYADTKTGAAAGIISAAHGRNNRETPLKIVLLAREGPREEDHGGADVPWIAAIKRESAGAQHLVAGMQAFHLEPLADTLEARQRMFRAARTAFAKTKKIEANGAWPEPDLSPPADQTKDDPFKRTLFVHAAALASLEGKRIESADDLLRDMREREERSWTAGLQAFELGGVATVDLFIDIAAIITLSGGLDKRKEALALIEKLPSAPQGQRAKLQQVVRLLAQLYPGDRFVDPVRPDLLGEHIVQQALTADDDLLDIALEPPANPAMALAVLRRLAERRHAIAQPWLERTAFELAKRFDTDTGGLILQIIDELPKQTSAFWPVCPRRSAKGTLASKLIAPSASTITVFTPPKPAVGRRRLRRAPRR
ncbi:MAG: hypothetical protein ACFB6S_07055 [Geminicoccaceae bacterium]